MDITQEQYNEIIRSQLETQQLIKSVSKDIQALIPLVEQNQHAIFGYNGTPGLLAWQQTQSISCVTCAGDIANLKNAIFGDPANRQDSGMQGEIKELKEAQEESLENRSKRD